MEVNRLQNVHVTNISCSLNARSLSPISLSPLPRNACSLPSLPNSPTLPPFQSSLIPSPPCSSLPPTLPSLAPNLPSLSPCPLPSLRASLPPPAPFPSSEWMVVVDVWNMTKPETGPGLGPKPERQGHRQLPKPKMSMDPKGSNQPQASGQFSYLKTISGRGPKPQRQGHRLLPIPKLSIEPKDSNQPKGIRTILIFKETKSGQGPKPERQGHRLLPKPKISKKVRTSI